MSENECKKKIKSKDLENVQGGAVIDVGRGSMEYPNKVNPPKPIITNPTDEDKPKMYDGFRQDY